MDLSLNSKKKNSAVNKLFFAYNLHVKVKKDLEHMIFDGHF